MRLTLADLEAFDPNARQGHPEREFLCPLGGVCAGKTSRKFRLNVPKGCYYCQRCGAKGKLGSENGQTYKPPAPPKNLKPKLALDEAMQGVIPLINTPAALYLKNKRGLPVEICALSGVGYNRMYYRRAAAMFPIIDQQGKPVAMQGRFLDKAEPKMISVGPKKNGIFAVAGSIVSGILAPDVAIVEAPIDALSLALLFDCPAIATCGSGIPDWLPEAANGQRVFIATDADQQGDKFFDLWGQPFSERGSIVKRLRPRYAKDWNAELLLRKK